MQSIYDAWGALRYGSALVGRMLLAIASALYSVLGFLGPSNPPPDSAYILMSGHREMWAVIFAVDALALGWRLVDPHPRPHWALFINLITFGLWVGITGGTVVVEQHVDPDLTGYVIICILAAIALVRTDLTPRDRETA